MFIAIISDLHDNLVNLKKCLIWCQNNKVEKLILCGDITTIETIDYLTSNFFKEIFMVSGNIETYSTIELKKYPNITYYGYLGIKKIGGLKIGFCHEPQKIKNLLAQTPNNLDFIFYGHTHKPWLKKINSTLVVNPGNIAGIFYQATFATLETNNKKIELKILINL